MPRVFTVLFAEQTTPDEMVVFLLVSVVLLLLVAFLLYTLVLAVLWRGRGRAVGSLRELLFPNGEQLRAYFGDYALAAATSLLLLLTVAARHDAVQTVLSYQLKDLRPEDVAGALPALTARPEDFTTGRDTSTAPDSVAVAYAADLSRMGAGLGVAGGVGLLPIQTLLVSVVKAGQPERAADWLKWSIRWAGLHPWQQFPRPGDLLVAAVLLLLAYVGWFAWNRERAVERSGKVPTTEYLRVAGRLLPPAVCIALLLVSAVRASDAEQVAESAAAAAPWMEQPAASPDPPAVRLTHAVTAENTRARGVDALLGVKDSLGVFLQRLSAVSSHLRALDDSAADLRAQIAALDALLRTGLDSLGGQAALDRQAAAADRARLDSLAGQLSAAETRLQELDASLAKVAPQAADALRTARLQEDAVQRLAARVDGVEGGLKDLQGKLDAVARGLPTTGLLFVSTVSPFRVDGPAGPVARGSGATLLDLPPGRYQVPGGRPGTVDIRAGHAVTVVVPVTVQ